jgi:hypothetical protein
MWEIIVVFGSIGVNRTRKKVGIKSYILRKKKVIEQR